MKKLMLYCGQQEYPAEAFEILGDYAGLYGDNGGDPDGNTWLPCPGYIPEDLQKQVVQAGLGAMVEVLMATDEGMIHFFSGMSHREEIDEETRESLIVQADDLLHWAHYGAYGAADSHWVFLKPEE